MTAAWGIAKPSLSRAADRPVITHGIQSGDVSADSGVVWARSDRPSRMLVEVATTESFNVMRSAFLVGLRYGSSCVGCNAVLMAAKLTFSL